MTEPLISVVMPVFNDENYIRDAIDSVLNQTYVNFELIIINDGSTDKSLNFIQSYVDSRITVLSRENRGLIESLNEGMRIARGKYIARHDSDDISHPLRFEAQVSFLEQNTDVYLLGTSALKIDEHGETIGKINRQCAVSKNDFYLSNPFIHGSVMFRSDVLHKVGTWYDPSMLYIEDYDFFWRICSEFRCCNLEDTFYFWRRHTKSISRQKIETQVKNVYLRRLLERGKVSEMQVQQLNRFHRNKLLAKIENNKAHHLLMDGNLKCCRYTYLFAALKYQSLRSFTYFTLSIARPKMLENLVLGK